MLILIGAVMTLCFTHTIALAQVGKKGEVKPAPTTPAKTAPAKKSPPARRTNSSTAPRNTAPRVSGAAANERTFWESIRSSNDAEDFRAYLKRYPNGVYADLARNRLRQLEAASNPTPRRDEAASPAVPRKEEGARTTTTASAPSAGAIVRNQIGMELVYIPAGSFMMGSDNVSNQEPVHRVTIREGFYMGRYEVTQAQWQAVMGTNPSGFEGGNLPVENVTWNRAQEFIRKLNARGDGYTYRLPTEAEWEYACRAGTTTTFAFGDSLSSEQANFDGNDPYGGAAKGVYRKKTTPVGNFQPNGWGLYDMHGNVAEWCEDVYHDNYNGAPVDGSAWLSGGEQHYRVVRGGTWHYAAILLRSATRDKEEPRYSFNYIGFRVVAVVRTN